MDTLLFSATKEEITDYYGGTGTHVLLVCLPVFFSSFLVLFVVSCLWVLLTAALVGIMMEWMLAVDPTFLWSGFLPHSTRTQGTQSVYMCG